jgi:predicted aldo/keto reductase-like oxidoreductase
LGGGAAISLAALAGCSPGERGSGGRTGADDIPPGEMTCRTNPKTGEKVSLLGFGLMRLPRRPKADTSGREDEIDQKAVNDLVDYAIAHGVNLFDTSPVYCKGMSERAAGIALSRHPRDRYFISTKMSNMSCPGREDSLQMYYNSFKELKVDYFDYYLVHAVGVYDIYKKRYLDNGLLDFLLREREAGRIRNLGWSFHGEKEFFDYMMNEAGVKWDFVMIQMNYFDWETALGRNTVTAKYLYDTLVKKGVPAVVMEPLLGGRLANLNFRAQAMLKQLKPDSSCASWAFRFVGSQPNVLTVLSGMMFKEHLQDNVRTYSPLEPLGAADYETLRRVVETMLEFRSINCTGCNYCMPCPYGLDIPAIFTHYNRCLSEGNFPDTAQAEDYKRARRAFLIGLDRSVPKLRQADHCIGCGNCIKERRCPQAIQIPQEMRKIDRFVEQLKIKG